MFLAFIAPPLSYFLRHADDMDSAVWTDGTNWL
jgi:hypothetical protein